jgi:hypothetical protein
MFPIILVVHWLHAFHLMHQGDWCTHWHAGRFVCTAARPHGGPVVLHVGVRHMHHLIRHGYECIHHLRAWLCTPNQIPL